MISRRKPQTRVRTRTIAATYQTVTLHCTSPPHLQTSLHRTPGRSTSNSSNQPKASKSAKDQQNLTPNTTFNILNIEYVQTPLIDGRESLVSVSLSLSLFITSSRCTESLREKVVILRALDRWLQLGFLHQMSSSTSWNCPTYSLYKVGSIMHNCRLRPRSTKMRRSYEQRQPRAQSPTETYQGPKRSPTDYRKQL